MLPVVQIVLILETEKSSLERFDRGFVPLIFLAESSALLNALGVYWGKKLGW